MHLVANTLVIDSPELFTDTTIFLSLLLVLEFLNADRGSAGREFECHFDLQGSTSRYNSRARFGRGFAFSSGMELLVVSVFGGVGIASSICER